MQDVAPAPALVVVGRAEDRRAHDGALEKRLFAKLPPATDVLAIGIADAALVDTARRANPRARWETIDPDGGLAPRTTPPELIVLGERVAALADPRPLLLALAEIAGPQTVLFTCLRNAAQGELLERIVEGDLTPLDDGAWRTGTLRHDSAASWFKRLMDAGWMPHLVERGAAPAMRPGVQQAVQALADALGVPRRTVERNLGTDTLVVEARLTFGRVPAAASGASFDVVVPTTREGQLRRDVEASPGLREVGARIVSYRRARDPAEALEQSLAHTQADWILFCHQDVYFPAGFGTRLDAVLQTIPAQERSRTLIGFAGLGMDVTTGVCAPAGFVIDRTDRFDHPASATGVSLDELAIVVSRDSIHRIDPSLGWHLWATDLSLTAIVRHGVFPRIVRLPLFHDSSNDYVLPEAFHASAAVLARKHSGFGTIHTLCGAIPAP